MTCENDGDIDADIDAEIDGIIQRSISIIIYERLYAISCYLWLLQGKQGLLAPIDRDSSCRF